MKIVLIPPIFPSLNSGQLSLAAAGLVNRTNANSGTVTIPLISSHKNSLIDQLESLPTNANSPTGPNSSLEDIPSREFMVRGQQSTKLFTVPLSVCDYIVSIEFCILAIQHCTMDHVSIVSSNGANDGQEGLPNGGISDSGTYKKVTSMIRNLESRLEILLLPTHDVGRTASIISNFETSVRKFCIFCVLVSFLFHHRFIQASEEVKHYMDKLLEDVDEGQAAILRQAEKDVAHREASLK
jgi:hypothetical protein